MYKNIDNCTYFQHKINLVRPNKYDDPQFNHQLIATKFKSYIFHYTQNSSFTSFNWSYCHLSLISNHVHRTEQLYIYTLKNLMHFRHKELTKNTVHHDRTCTAVWHMQFTLAAMLQFQWVDTTTSAICYKTLDYFSPFCLIREEGGASAVVNDRRKWALGNSGFYYYVTAHIMSYANSKYQKLL